MNDLYVYQLETENKQLRKALQEERERNKKAREYIKEHIRIDDEYPDYMEMLIEERNELLEILGDKENE